MSKTSTPDGSDHGKPQPSSAKRKLQAVQRLMGGESLEAVSRDLAVPVARLSEWRDQALVLAGAESSLKAQPRPRARSPWASGSTMGPRWRAVPTS